MISYTRIRNSGDELIGGLTSRWMRWIDGSADQLVENKTWDGYKSSGKKAKEMNNNTNAGAYTNTGANTNAGANANTGANAGSYYNNNGKNGYGPGTQYPKRKSTATIIVAIALILMGVSYIINTFLPWVFAWLDSGLVIAIAAIIVGFGLLLKR